jgi:flavin reductase (DIM6/NTAB) family NADH-FMN oxidoreductase RutF
MKRNQRVQAELKRGRMEFDFEALEKRTRYKLLCSFVAPRPIAFLTTLSRDGVPNAAPFSFFNVFGDDPPIIILGLNDRAEGGPKDTTTNIKETGEFVAHMVDRPLGQAMVECSVEFSPDVDEVVETGLQTVPSVKVKPGRIAQAPAAMECHLETTIDYVGRAIILGRVVHMHVRDDCIDPETLYVDSNVYHPLARLHADNYIAAEDQFEIHKPSLEEYLSYKHVQDRRRRQ